MAPQVALTRPRLLRFALHFTILSLNVRLNLALGPNKGVEEDREDPVLINEGIRKPRNLVHLGYIKCFVEGPGGGLPAVKP